MAAGGLAEEAMEVAVMVAGGLVEEVMEVVMAAETEGLPAAVTEMAELEEEEKAGVEMEPGAMVVDKPQGSSSPAGLLGECVCCWYCFSAAVWC